MNDAVEVTWLSLDQPPEVVTSLETLLDGDEHARVARLADPAERSRTTVRLARRRELLGKYGRRREGDAGPVVWSSSHRDGHGLFAVATGRRLGVDVESVDEVTDPIRLAALVATSDEHRHVARLAEAARADAVAGLWTRKEAYLKATREGIGSGMDHVAVPFVANPAGLPFRPSVDGPTWLLYELASPAHGYRAALVVEQLAPREAPCEVHVAFA